MKNFVKLAKLVPFSTIFVEARTATYSNNTTQLTRKYQHDIPPGTYRLHPSGHTIPAPTPQQLPQSIVPKGPDWVLAPDGLSSDMGVRIPAGIIKLLSTVQGLTVLYKFGTDVIALSAEYQVHVRHTPRTNVLISGITVALHEELKAQATGYGISTNRLILDILEAYKPQCDDNCQELT